jgi:hypothetical protein
MTATAQNMVARDQDLIDKIGKLLAVAASTTSDAERESFTNRAMALLAANNLDMAAVEQGTSGAKAAKRTDEKRKGGFYKFQRALWADVADLNFCMYFSLRTFIPGRINRSVRQRYGSTEAARLAGEGGYEFQHRLVGRTVNVAGTLAMTGYLEEAIERKVRARLPEQPKLWYSPEMAAYREGIADEIRRKIRKRRKQQLDEEQIKTAAAEEAEAEKYKAGNPTGRGITLSSVKQTESDANYDFIHGDGASAKKRAMLARARAEEAEARRLEEEAYTKWAAENPKEVARQAAEERRRQKQRDAYIPKGNTRTKADKYDNAEYWLGREAGASISIDQQVDSGTKGFLK